MKWNKFEKTLDGRKKYESPSESLNKYEKCTYLFLLSTFPHIVFSIILKARI